MNGALLELEDLSVRFGDARACDGVDLDIAHGEVVALVGESGCGKTTLARTIVGLEQPFSGQVRFEGEAIPIGSRRSKAYRRAVQMVFQDPTGALNPRQTIYEAVAEGIRIQGLHGTEEERVAQALSQCGMRPPGDFFLRYPHEVSGGQRQRVVIAGAMALEPRLIVADEPVSALDASVRGEILALMLNLVQETGISILAITHDLGLAWNIADRVAVMYLGRIVELGTTEEVLERPRHPYTRALLSVVPETKKLRQEVLTGEPPDPKNIPAGCRFRPRCPLVQSGEAERLGLLARCEGDDPVLLPAGAPHQAACHAANRDA
ncbi:MAG TPA: ABC transporter ATP-binding protein [Acidimicrobiales bacterium]